MHPRLAAQKKPPPPTLQARFREFVAGKRCIIVCPGGYTEGQGRGEWIDSFDVVVRPNWGCPVPAALEADLGRRTDVLYKRLLKLGKTEEVDVEDYLNAGLGWLVAIDHVGMSGPNWKHITERVGDRIPVIWDRHTRGILRQRLLCSPLVGAIALHNLLENGAASVAIYGMDFYESGYHAGYGGRAYRESMGRKEGTIGPTHDALKHSRYLVKLRETGAPVEWDDVLERRMKELLMEKKTVTPLRRQNRPKPISVRARPESEYYEWLRGKSVIIVGPAAYLEGSGKGAWIDSHDVIVRMNASSPVPDGLKADLGSRTDVLYHTIFPPRFSDATGAAHSQALTRSWVADGVQYLVSRWPESHKRNLPLIKTVAGIVPWVSVGHLGIDLKKGGAKAGGNGANTGLVAFMHLLGSRLKSLHVTGCDFHQTGYFTGYQGMSAEEAAAGREESAWRRAMGEPPRDWESFIRPQIALMEARRKKDARVSFDTELERLCQFATGPMAGVLAVVPARWESSRLPGKPLIALHGKPMILWTVEAVAASGCRTVVATDDERIAEVVRGAGFEAMLTPEALTGTDRVAMVAERIEASIYLDVQGDEPLMDAEDIRRVVEAKRETPGEVVTGMHRLAVDPMAGSVVKAVVSDAGRLLYASRWPVPGNKAMALRQAQDERPPYWKHLGLYAFSRDELRRYHGFGRRSFAEEAEDIEVLRFLELGIPVRLVEVEGSEHSVDVPADVEYVERLMVERGLVREAAAV